MAAAGVTEPPQSVCLEHRFFYFHFQPGGMRARGGPSAHGLAVTGYA